VVERQFQVGVNFGCPRLSFSVELKVPVEHRRGWISCVDGLAVGLEPLAHLLETLDLGSGDDAVRVWSDVQQVVAALAGDSIRLRRRVSVDLKLVS